MRVLAVICPHWPITALGFTDREHVAVLESGRVVAASARARAVGVTRGQRRRHAEHLCPELVVVSRDLVLEARRFESIVAAIGELTPLVEVMRPGICILNARGPARYFGGEFALRTKITESVTRVLPEGGLPVRVGIAEGRFAAGLAARHDMVVPSKETQTFLAPLAIAVLGEQDLVDLLLRLGIRTLGDFAALDEDVVGARFGELGMTAHRRARGFDDEALHPEVPEVEIAVQTEFDPPALRADVATFAARGLADDLSDRLTERGLACGRLRIEAETDHAEQLSRLWRSETDFRPDTVVERLRWQLEGWLAGNISEPAPTAGITLLRVVADGVYRATGRQLGFFGERSDRDIRAARSLDRLSGLLGPKAVFTATLQGGRSPTERVVLTPWGELVMTNRDDGPWPGHHPLPAPALVYETLFPAEVLGVDNKPVRVLQRGAVSSAPQRISIDGAPWVEIIAWSGPWLSDERSWDKQMRLRRSRFQILTSTQVGHLCVVEMNQWWIEATYD